MFKSILSSLLFLLYSNAFSEITLGLQESEVLAELGSPIGFLEVGNKRILKYRDQTIVLKNKLVVETRTVGRSIFDDRVDVVILDAQGVVGREPVGVVVGKDAFIRGGKFRQSPQEHLKVPFVSVSGLQEHFRNDWSSDEKESFLNQVRKAYLKFEIGEQQYSRAMLILHTSRNWEFDTSHRSPAVSVFATKSDFAAQKSNADWDEASITWGNAVGNSMSQGADLRNMKRLVTKSFPPNSDDGILDESALRFDLGHLSEFMAEDGSVTLLVTHSSPIRLDFISKDAEKPSFLKPRLLLK